ncbi:MAG TPA: MerR family transcriptional regulator [Thermoanaerobaculia bacterium]|nr:MerR family transcriptional regulator [Thermoanaerobaculia bacterium]
MSTPAATAPRHPIGVVARRTGLKPDLIRAWERRYGAVAPGRTDTRRRFYSDADIERLLLLRRVVGTGRGIGQVAGLSNEDLQALIDEESSRQVPPGPDRLSAATGGTAEPFLALCLSAAERLDVRDLEMQVGRASIVLSRTALLEKLLVPLMQRIGDLWQQGTLRPVHEHMASAVVRSFIGGMDGTYALPPTAPHLVVTTPSRQQHELGALVAAAMAASEGWQVTYLGPDLPPQEIAAAVLQKGARAVALGLTYPPDDPLLVEDLKRLRRMLPLGTELIVGGRACCAYALTLEEIGARRIEDFENLRRELQALRMAPPES